MARLIVKIAAVAVVTYLFLHAWGVPLGIAGGIAMAVIALV